MAVNTLHVSGLSYHQLPEKVKRDLFNALINDLRECIHYEKLAAFFIEQLMAARLLAHHKPEPEQSTPPSGLGIPHKTPKPVDSQQIKHIMETFRRYRNEIDKITIKLDGLGAAIKKGAELIVNLLAEAAHVPAATVAPTVHSTLSHMAAHIAHGMGFVPTTAAAAFTTATPTAGIPAPSAPPAPLSALLPVFTDTSAEKSGLVVSTPTLTPSAGKKEKKKFLDYLTNTYSSILQQSLSLDSRPSGLARLLRTFSLDIIDQFHLLQRLDERLQAADQFLQSFAPPRNRHANSTQSSYTLSALLAQQGFFPESGAESLNTDTAPRPHWITGRRQRSH